jgi:hypothetical protein
MYVTFSDDDLTDYMAKNASVSREHPVVISKFIMEAKVSLGEKDLGDFPYNCPEITSRRDFLILWT